MPFVTSSKTKPTYDVIIVGSGAAGGQSAYVLAAAGLKILMLEAGRNYDPVAETPMFQTPNQAPLRAAGTADKYFGFYDATVNGGWLVPNEPYMVKNKRMGSMWVEASDYARGGTDQNFIWWRARMLGGRTNHWGRFSFRMGPYDFKPKSRDGLGIDWPMNYSDLAPYYDKVEALIGVYGSNEGLENTPDSSPGILLPPPKPRAYELLTKKFCAKLGIPVIPAHVAVLSRKQDHEKIPAMLHPDNPKAASALADNMRTRLACFWATACGRGCSIKANYQSTTVHIPPALASGNLDIITDAMVREVTVDDRGRATGVHYIDKPTGKEMHAAARVVVLAASGCESARILLNSKSAVFPNGLANGSGKVGRYLMDTVGTSLGGQIPALENCPPHNEDGASVMHMYMPWWKYREQMAGKMDFPRGYHIEFSGGRRMPETGTFSGLEQFTGGSYGEKFKEDARRYYGSFIYFAGRGEMIPNEDSYCELDPNKKDAWGIPVLRFHFKWSDHELKQAAHMQKTFAEIIRAMGGKVLTPTQTDGAKAIGAGGSVIHEVGTTCMGADPKNSVLNQYCQAWEVKNLFVTDGGPFVSNADKNPTLSIMANAWRSCDYLAGELKEETSDMNEPQRINRRDAIKWVLAASATVSLLDFRSFGAGAAAATGYGGDPDLVKFYKPGEVWPLTLTKEQHRTTAVLCDAIIPADEKSPSASSVNVPDFIDEWISAPHPEQAADRKIIIAGLAWLDGESQKRFHQPFANLTTVQQQKICEDICHVPKAKPEFANAAIFFAKFRNLTAAGFYTTPAGWKDIQYVGNVPLTQFDGPPPEVLVHLGLA